MKKRYIKIGSLSLVLGIALMSLSFLEGFSANSISDTLSNGLLMVRIGVIVGIVAIAFSVFCFVASVTSEKE